MQSTTSPIRAATEPPALAAQELACRNLIASCERALYELRCSLGRAQAPAQVRIGLGAAALLEEVLLGWRENLSLLELRSFGRRD